jgi:hypothetical protein
MQIFILFFKFKNNKNQLALTESFYNELPDVLDALTIVVKIVSPIILIENQ